jgi:RNA polymerase sigma factor (sigma-70 family)
VTGASDADVIEESLRDVGRFGEIFDRHAQAIFRFLGRRIGPDDAGDVLGDVFLAAFEARGRYDGRQPTALPWLYGIASNLLGKHYRQRASELRALERMIGHSAPDDHADAVSAAADAEVQLRGLAKVLEELPAGEREVLLMFAWEELSYGEIARATSLSHGAFATEPGAAATARGGR